MRMSEPPFRSKSVLVVGGTSGMGAAVARSFVGAGARVMVTGLSETEIERFTADEEGIEARPLDVRDERSVAGLAEQIDGLDVLVHMAGTILRGGAEFEMESFQSVLDVNLNGAMRVSTAFHSKLIRSRGSVVHVASLYSQFGAPHAPAYSASKGAVVQLTKSLACAWAKDGIRVNAVAPGWIETPFTEAVRRSEDRSRSIIDRTPMGRWGQPEDVVGPVLFLASEAARFVTGVVLPVDGGFSIAG